MKNSMTVNIDIEFDVDMDDREVAIYEALAKEFGEKSVDDALNWIITARMEKILDTYMMDIDLGDIQEDVREILMHESLASTF